jgi:glycosyltransferase involved in cell wall biosynthesis
VSAPIPGIDRPLRIVQAAAFPFPSPQGSQVFVRGMARALARRGHEVTVACYAHGLGTPDPEYRVVRTPAIPGYRNLRAGPDLVKPALDLALAVQISRIPADVVHAHNYEAPLAAVMARRLTGVPVVYGAHNTMSEELHTYFQGAGARRIARRLGRWMDRTIPRMADHALALTPGGVDTLAGLGCHSVSHAPPGVDMDELHCPVPEVLPGGPWVVYAGNPDRYQDLDVLIAAMRQVPEAGLLLVSASSLDEWAHSGLPRLRCITTTDFERVKALMAGAAIAALPRAVCSGYPIKLLNYLGLGLPTVAAAGSAQDLPGVIAVPNRDPAAMAEAIREILQDSERRAALGTRARAHVASECTWEARARGLEGVYAAVLRRRASVMNRG